MDPKFLRSMMGLFATGVTVVSYKANETPAGMTANAFMSVSLDPALILISVRVESKFNEYVKLGDCYAVNLLAEAQLDISNHFGGRPDSSLQVPFTDQNGTPIVKGSLAHIVAKTVDIHKAGDHNLFIAEVQDIQEGQQENPLLFYAGKYRKIDEMVA